MFRWIGVLTANHRRLRLLRRMVLSVPRPVMFALVTALGWAIHFFARDFRTTVMRNVATLIPDHVPPRLRSSFCRRYIVHECLTIYEQTLEFQRAFRTDGRGVDFHLDGITHLDAVLAEGRGAIVFSPHVGNYFYSFWRMAQHCRSLSVVTAGDPALRRLFLQYRRLGLRAHDYDTVPPHSLALKLREHLGRNGLVFLLSDHARPNFHDVTLFGRPSQVPPGAVALSLRLKVPIVPFVGTRESWTTHRLAFKPAVRLYERYGLGARDEAMQEMTRVLEGLILERPHQWLYWFNVHERWKTPAVPTS